MKHIVVGTDATPRGREAVLVASELAMATGANLHVVSCTDSRKTTSMNVGSDSFHDDPVALAQQVLASITGTLPNDQITTAVSSDTPAKALCEEAERLDADMIVVGNKRVQGAARVLGSIANDVMKQAPCHVLVADTGALD